MPTTELNAAEYRALRDTIRERGTIRLCAVLAGLAAWGALALALRIALLDGPVTLVPLVVLFATFEINFFIHTGVERVGRYIQVFYDERGAAPGWESAAMSYGARFPAGGLDPLFAAIFIVAGVLNFVVSLGHWQPGWTAISLLAHLAFNYRIVRARQASRTQRALDLDRFRALASK